jgi:hypothetical protein
LIIIWGITDSPTTRFILDGSFITSPWGVSNISRIHVMGWLDHSLAWGGGLNILFSNLGFFFFFFFFKYSLKNVIRTLSLPHSLKWLWKLLLNPKFKSVSFKVQRWFSLSHYEVCTWEWECVVFSTLLFVKN